MQAKALEVLKQAGFDPYQAWAIVRAIEIEIARAEQVPVVRSTAVPDSRHAAAPPEGFEVR